jgi:hypothetical protein
LRKAPSPRAASCTAAFGGRPLTRMVVLSCQAKPSHAVRQRLDPSCRRPQFLRQRPELLRQQTGCSRQRTEFLRQRTECLRQRPQFLRQRLDCLRQQPDFLRQSSLFLRLRSDWGLMRGRPHRENGLCLLRVSVGGCAEGRLRRRATSWTAASGGRPLARKAASRRVASLEGHFVEGRSAEGGFAEGRLRRKGSGAVGRPRVSAALAPEARPRAKRAITRSLPSACGRVDGWG